MNLATECTYVYAAGETSCDVARGLRPGVGEMFLWLLDVEGCFEDAQLSAGDEIHQRRGIFPVPFLEIG